MTGSRPDVGALVHEMPDADSPGKTSKFTGPPPEVAERIVGQILEGGRESILELIGMIRDATGGGAENYKPGYTLHCLALHVGRPGKENERRMFAEALASRIGGDAPSKDVQGFLIRELQTAGGSEVVGALGKVLLDDDLGGYAAQALIAIGEGALGHLRDAFGRATGRNRVTIAQALGVLGDVKSVAALKGAAVESDRNVRMAATWALATIGAPESADVLTKAADTKDGWERIQATKACLLLAERLLDSGKKKEARRIYEHLSETRREPADRYLREAAEKALRGIG